VTLTTGGSFGDKVNFIWSVADLLRGDFRQSEYGRVILPFVVVRRLDCVLADTKRAVRTKAAQLDGVIDDPERVLCAVAEADFYNTSPLDFASLTADASNVLGNLQGYIGGFSPGARDVIDEFRFDEQIVRLAGAGLLYQVVAKFADINLHPDVVGETEMGYTYEELIRRFSEQSNETAGEHFTPREVIRLMVDLLLCEDDRQLRDKGVVKTLFDPACGTRTTWPSGPRWSSTTSAATWPTRSTARPRPWWSPPPACTPSATSRPSTPTWPTSTSLT